MHQIQRQIIEVKIRGASDGFRWQQDLERLCTTYLPERLDAVFEQYNPAATLVLDRLELDLGNLSEAAFEEEFLKAIEKELSARLAQFRSSPAENQPYTPFDAFLYFLESGTLPWWADAEAYRRFVQEAEKPESWNAHRPEQLVALTESLRTKPQAFQRLREQFSELFLVQLTILLFQKMDTGVFPKWFMLQRVVQEHRLFSTLALPRLFYSKLIENLVFFPALSGDVFVKILYRTLADPSLKAQVLSSLPLASWENFLNEVRQTFGDFDLLQRSTPALRETVREVASSEREREENAAPKEEGEQYYITNAGLVLLAPFLAEYLKMCDVASDAQVLDPDKAVHLIQYLATGQTTTPEYELVFNKLLCGLAIHTPVSEGIYLTEAQRKEAEDVLDAVLRYWPVMKNTSRTGLQASFLQRPAKLSHRPNADSVSNAVSVHRGSWLLQVEQAAYDLLLNELPWSYSPVALPWMPEPIWIEWS